MTICPINVYTLLLLYFPHLLLIRPYTFAGPTVLSDAGVVGRERKGSVRPFPARTPFLYMPCTPPHRLHIPIPVPVPIPLPGTSRNKATSSDRCFEALNISLRLSPPANFSPGKWADREIGFDLCRRRVGDSDNSTKIELMWLESSDCSSSICFFSKILFVVFAGIYRRSLIAMGSNGAEAST